MMRTIHKLQITTAAALALSVPTLSLADPTFDFYGQLNFGLFSVDDGTESETFITDNDNSNTRVGATYSNDLGNGGTVKGHFETALGIDGSSVATMDNNDSDIDLNRTELRKLELIYETAGYGTFYGGQGSMSTDGVAEVDFSGTTVVAYSSVTDLAGSFEFRPDRGALSGTSISNAFNSYDGARRARVRYDTPTYKGFTGSISWGKELLVVPDKREFTDIAVKYANDYGQYKVDGRLGYQWINATEDGETDEEVLSGSVAVLHTPTGLNFAFASGAADKADSSYYFVKVGYIQDWLSLGTTALSFDITEGSDFDTKGSDSESIAISAVQRVDAYNLEIYASYRTYEYDAKGTDYEDIDLVVVGARWKF
ncbi:MAG: porin [Roseobacter sp.]